MTKDEYKALRQSIGPQSAVADRLGITVQTIINRETGRSPITKEAELALRYLEQDSGKEVHPAKDITPPAPAVQPAPPPAKPETAPKAKAVPTAAVVRAPIFKPSGKL